MEASRRPGSHYNVMQPLKTSFAATGTDKMSRYSWDEAGGWKTICLCLRWCSEGDHCLKIKFRVMLGWKVKHMYQDFITLEMVVGNVLESGACFSSSQAILELWKSQYTVNQISWSFPAQLVASLLLAIVNQWKWLKVKFSTELSMAQCCRVVVHQSEGRWFVFQHSQYDDVSLGNILMAQPMVCESP